MDDLLLEIQFVENKLETVYEYLENNKREYTMWKTCSPKRNRQIKIIKGIPKSIYEINLRRYKKILKDVRDNEKLLLKEIKQQEQELNILQDKLQNDLSYGWSENKDLEFI